MAHDIVLVKKSLRLCLLAAVICVAACATSTHVLVGQTRTPLSPDQVRIYLEPVSGQYDSIAVVDASSTLSLSLTAGAKAETVLTRLRAEAARLGANGIVLQEITDGPAASAGVGVAPDLTRDHASIGVGFNATGLLGNRYGRGLAIYIAPEQTGQRLH